jgi:hypothetical protein
MTLSREVKGGGLTDAGAGPCDEGDGHRFFNLCANFFLSLATLGLITIWQ